MASELLGTLRFVDMDIFHDLYGNSGKTEFDKDLLFVQHIFWLSVQKTKDYINLYGRFYIGAGLELADEVDLAPMRLFLNHLRIVSMNNNFSTLPFINIYTNLHAVGQRRTVDLLFPSIRESDTSGFGYRWDKVGRRTTFTGFVHPLITLSPFLI